MFEQKTDVLGMKRTCSNAALEGQLECLKYAHEKTDVLGINILVLLLPEMVTSSV